MSKIAASGETACCCLGCLIGQAEHSSMTAERTRQPHALKTKEFSDDVIHDFCIEISLLWYCCVPPTFPIYPLYSTLYCTVCIKEAYCIQYILYSTTLQSATVHHVPWHNMIQNILCSVSYCTMFDKLWVFWLVLRNSIAWLIVKVRRSSQIFPALSGLHNGATKKCIKLVITIIAIMSAIIAIIIIVL